MPPGTSPIFRFMQYWKRVAQSKMVFAWKKGCLDSENKAWDMRSWQKLHLHCASFALHSVTNKLISCTNLKGNQGNQQLHSGSFE